MSRGGRRAGAGAPRGNLNALRHGGRSRDPSLRALVEGWSGRAEDVEALARYLRGLAKGRRPLEAAAEAPPSNVIPFFRPPSSSTAPVQSEAQRAADGPLGRPTASGVRSDGPASALVAAVSSRLAGHGFRGGPAFVRQHFAVAGSIEALLDELDGLSPEEYRRFRNPGGYIRAVVHDEVAPEGACRFCGWRRPPVAVAASE